MMKKIFCLSVVAALFSAAIVSCGPKEVAVTEVKLDKTNLTLTVSDVEFLTATVLPNDADVKDISWSSSDVNIATVEDGKVTAKSEGVAIITVTTVDGGKKATCTVTVNALHPAETEMAFVEGGTFTMGGTDDEVEEFYWELPPHEVTLSSFMIAKSTVTQGQWKLLMSANPSQNKGDDLPVEMVTRQQVAEFIKLLNEATGKNYRLPTEAEWEYAARGGKDSKGYKYSGSNNVDEVAWYQENSGKKTQAVGKKKANELGIYDMSGNISEYCSDWYASYTDVPQTDPKGPNTGFDMVIRGGSNGTAASSCRVSYRQTFPPSGPNNRAGFVGFRLVLPVQ